DARHWRLPVPRSNAGAGYACRFAADAALADRGATSATTGTSPPPRRPGVDDAGDGGHAVGERGRAGLQDQWRLDLVQLALAHRRDRVPARACGHLLRTEALAAPG